jgi:hypothetical protein
MPPNIKHLILGLSFCCLNTLYWPKSASAETIKSCMPNTLVSIGDLRPEDAPTCFQQSNCIETTRYDDTMHAVCFANFRLEQGEILVFEMARAFSRVSPEAMPYPPYIQMTWGGLSISDKEQTISLNCKTRKMVTSYANDPDLESWQAVICDEITSSLGFASPAETRGQLPTANAQQHQQIPTTSSQPIQVRPQLYETLSNTPFYWKHY